jgi:antitoxin component of MazEF toxin-antitoxin module
VGEFTTGPGANMRVDKPSEVSLPRQSEVATRSEKACIDRFEKTGDGRTLAVLLVGDQEKVLDVPKNQLPAGAKEGDWLEVELQGDKLVGARIDVKETETRRQEIQDLFESVVEKPKTVASRACIDRVEETEDGRKLAVLLVGDEEKVVNVPLSSLPAGAREGDWLKVEFEGDKLVGAKADPKQTEKQRNLIQRLFDMLFGR